MKLKNLDTFRIGRVTKFNSSTSIGTSISIGTSVAWTPNTFLIVGHLKAE